MLRRMNNMLNANYVKAMITKILGSLHNEVKPNIELQQLYESTSNHEEMLMALQRYNYAQSKPFLASGMSCYFNDQVDEHGLSNLKLSRQDMEDAKFIASCFGKDVNYSVNDLSIVYTTLLGTTEFNYGMQTFPAGIFEDVFQCSADHRLPIQPVVGESEPDFFCRVLDYQISQFNHFPTEKRIEALARAKRLTSHFCSGKNRVYVIPFEDVIHHKASFGDIEGLRDGKLSGEELKQKLDKLHTLEQLLQLFEITVENGMDPYNDMNMKSEYGIAIYGPIASKDISFLEVNRMYDLMQTKARDMGYVDGDVIPDDLDYLNHHRSRSVR